MKVKYPYAYVDFNGITKFAGKLDSIKFLRNLIKAMHNDDDFAVAMAELMDFNELVTGFWEDTDYEDVAIDAVYWFKSDYREWYGLRERGREDNDWVIVSDDESIVVSG